MAGYERFLGWRYLLRAHRKPRTFKVGLALVTLGALGLWGSAVARSHSAELATWWMGSAETGGDWDTARFSLQYTIEQASQLVQGGGLALTVIGVCVALFGGLYWFMTTFSAFSTFMIAMGVAEVILVLGVMNGFQGYLRSKLVDANAHIMIEPPRSARWLENYRAIADEARAVEGVLGVSPTITSEVMLRVPSQDLSSATRLLGIDIKSIDETIQLTRFVKEGCGCLETLDEPEHVERYLSSTPFPSVQGFCGLPCPELKGATGAGASGEAEPAGRQQLGGLMAIPKPARPKARPTLLLGVHLRYTLGLSPGQRVDVISPLGDIGPNGPIPRLKPYSLGGWVTSGLADIDAHQAYSSLRDTQRFLGVGDVVSELRVRVASVEAARAVRDRLQTQLGDRVIVKDWREKNSSLFSALQLERIAMFLVLTINILLAAFSITSTLVMTLIERRREIAILLAMGARRRSIVQIFMSQGLSTGVIGSALGVAIGGGGCAIIALLGLPLNAEEIYYISAIPVEVKLFDVVAIVSVALGVSLASTVYPAYYASKIRPVEGLKGR